MSSIRYCHHCKKEIYDHANCYDRAMRFKEMENSVKDWKSKYEEVREMLMRLCEVAQTYEIEYGLPQDIFEWFEKQKETK